MSTGSNETGWMWRAAVRFGASALARYLTEASPSDMRLVVPVSLTLHRPGAPPPPGDATLSATTAAVERTVDRHLRALGVPGIPDVEVAVEPTPGLDGEAYALRVCGRRMRCARVDVADILAEHAGGATLAEVGWSRLPDVAADLCAAALQTRLSTLVSDRGCAQLFDEADVHPDRRPDLAEALRVVVDHAVSVVDVAELARVAKQTPPDPVMVAERLINRLRAPTLDILFAPGTLRSVTTRQPDEQDLFTDMRTRIYTDLGILAPDFRLRPDDTVPDGRVAFRLNAVRTRSWAVPPLLPLTAVTDRLESLVRRHAAWFVSMSTIAEILDTLRWALPDTVQGADERCPPEWQSALARAMLDEGLSVRHVPTLLDRLIDLDPDPAPSTATRLREGPTPVDRFGATERLPRPGRAVSMMRQRQLEGALRMRDDHPGLARRDLDPRMEDELVRVRAAGFSDTEELLERIAVDVRQWQDDATGVPLVVRSTELRPWLHDQLRAEFPDLRVLAAQEFPPTVAAAEQRAR